MTHDQSHAANVRDEWFIDSYGGGWWVHHREDRQPRRGPFATHPEAVREYSRLTEQPQSHAAST